jgi:hypothetical protein
VSRQETTQWSANEQGLWCLSCGNLVATAHAAGEPDFVEPDECRQCGYPDPDAVADYHVGPDEPDDLEDDLFDCGLMPNGQCTKAGTEECDWECGRL